MSPREHLVVPHVRRRTPRRIVMLAIATALAILVGGLGGLALFLIFGAL